MTKEKTKLKAVKGLKYRPLYDPLTEQLNDKAQKATDERTRESRIGTIRDHERQSAQGRSKGLIEHASRIRPDKSCEYVGTFCVHLYKKPGFGDTASYQFISLSPGADRMTHTLAQEALKSLGRHIFDIFGIKLPATRDMKKKKEQAIRDNL